MTAAAQRQEVGPIVRPATADEMRLVLSSWCKSWSPRAHDCTGGVMRWGSGRTVARETARKMHARYAESVASPNTVLAAAIPTPDGGSEMLGWICRTLVQRRDKSDYVVVHFVYTLKSARHRGLGSMLMRYVTAEADAAGATVEHGCSNTAGLALLEGMR